jgi:outer membrane protein assembly factor BamB
MPIPNTPFTAPGQLRLWPGVVAVLLQWVFWIVVPRVPGGGLVAVVGGVLGGVVVALWWLFFSRAPWAERLGALVLMVAAVLATSRLVDPSIAGGMMGMMLYVYSVPALSLALVAGALAARRRSAASRRAAIAFSILLACGVFTLLRTAGIVGEGSELHWRWTPTPEERLLAEGDALDRARDAAPRAVDPKPSPAAVPAVPAPTERPAAAAGAPAGAPAPPASPKALHQAGAAHAGEDSAPSAEMPVVKRADWPGFRGADRDGIVRGVRIETDWSTSPPVQLWRRPIGPGWSSFAVDGDLLYTQEQRGGDEIVGSYRVSSGEPVWRHRDDVRFWESNGGAGPRATPTLSNNRVYAFGATGILNALDAASGAVIWQRNVAAETKTDVPDWGFSSSPLVVGDLVIVAADATMAAYDLETGRPRWVGPTHRGSYSSPHRTTIAGVEQVVLLGGSGVTSLAPATGTLLWEHAWRGVAIVQPALTPDGVIVNNIAATGGNGTRRLAVAHRSGAWTVEEKWTSTGLKPYFNDFVLHEGHAFGFDGSILSCISLEDGQRKWKGGRYGNGQLVLLPDQDLLLVLTEEGDLALVDATPERFNELVRVPAIAGKTWNHPVAVRDVLLVRNGEEMAAFRLPLADR